MELNLIKNGDIKQIQLEDNISNELKEPNSLFLQKYLKDGS